MKTKISLLKGGPIILPGILLKKATLHQLIKIKLLVAVLLFSSVQSFCADGDPLLNHTKRQYNVTPWGHTRWGLEYLPDNFYTSTEKYPIIVYFHGTGETGGNEWSLGKLTYNGPSNFIAYANYNMQFVNPNSGQLQKCIYIALQDPYWSPDINEVWYVLKNNPRLKDRISNIFYTGLSAGGQQTMNGVLFNQEMASGISAIVPMSSAGFIRSGVPYARNSNVKAWCFHGLADGVTSYTVTKDFNDSLGVGKSRWTQQPPIHGLWNTIYTQTYREVINGQLVNIYEWMLSTIPVGTNIPPVSNAGADISITLPINTATLSGSGTDPDGTITNYQWTKISGPTAGTITNPTSAIATATGLVQGTYNFQLEVTDNNGATATDVMVVTVNAAIPPPNQLPTANAGADVNITLPINTATLSGSGTDPDGTITNYQWTKISGPTAGTITNPTSAIATATGLVQGTYNFQLEVTDNNGATATDVMIVTVNAAIPPPNQLPTANAGADISITLPINTATLSGSGTDPDGTITNYQWTKISGPTAGSITNATSAIATATGLVQGVYNFQLQVTDNNGATATDVMIVTVNAAIPPPNQLPTANAGADVNITLPVNTAILSGSGTDPDGTITNYQWTKISGPTAGTITNATLAIATATGLVQGTYNFQLQVTDNNGATATDVLVVTVNAAIPPPNQLPTANAGADVNITLPINTATLSGSGTDPDGTITNYQWTKISGPTAGTITNPTSAIATATGLVQGTYNFQLEVTDNNGATATDVMIVTVNAAIPPPNQLPTANAGADVNITLPINTATLSGSGTDPDGTITNYQWTKISGPTAGTITNPTSAIATATGLVQGTYNFQLEVTDNNGATATDVMIVTVNAAIPPPNQLPTANAGADISITLPINTATLSGSGTDPDGTITNYQWTKISGPTAGSITNQTSAIATAINLIQGVYQFQLQVTDNNGATATDVMNVTVNAAIPPPNQLPTANAGADVNITLPINTATLSGSGTDPDGTITNYQWTKISGPTAGSITNPTSAIATAINLIQGVYHFQLQVTDNNGATATDVMIVTVNAAIPPPNQLPTANAGADVNITLPINTATLSGSGTDPDGTITNYQWTKISGPTAGTITNPTSAIATATGLVQGTYNFQLEVTDNNGATATDVMIVTVNAAIPPPNQLPTANAGADISITLPINTATLSGSGTDPDGTITNYQWTKISGPTAGTITNPTSAIATATGLVQGTYNFQLEVTDNNGATATDVMIVTVNAAIPPPNQLPTANAGADISITLPINTATLSGSGTDPDGTITNYQWTKISGPTAGTITNPTSAIATATGLVQGTYNFQLEVTDNNGATATDVMIVTVNAAIPPPNQLPTANAGADISITLPINTATLSGSGTDPDGTITNYQWTKISGPTAGTITNPTSAIATATGLVQGVYNFQLKVTDNNGATATDVMNVTVNAAIPPPNQLPTANAGADVNITLPINTATLSGSGTDPDGTITNYQWTKISGPTAGTITNPTSAIATATGLVQGVYNFQLQVTDNNGATATDVMVVTVNAAPIPNQAPVADAGPHQNITLPVNTAILSGSGTDPDGTITNYQWTKLSGPTAGSITNATSAIATAVGMVQGVYQFQLEVTDNNGATARDMMQITVNAALPIPNQLPLANAGTDINIYLPFNTADLAGSGIDPDGSIVSFTWSIISGPAQYKITDPSIAQTILKDLQQGNYEAELTVVDNNGATGRDTVRISVGSSKQEAAEYIRIMPNPVQDKLNVEINTGRTDRKVLIVVTNISGAIIIKKEIMLMQNVQMESMDMAKYPKGTYLLTIFAEGEKPVNNKIIKL